MTQAANSDLPINYVAIYLPIHGVHHQNIPYSATCLEDLYQQAETGCPRGKFLSRLVRAGDPSRSLWESGKGWIPQPSDQSGRDWY